MISVLYVDDESSLLDLCKLFLEKTGDFNVDTYISAHEALETPPKTSFDCIVSDYQMPDMNGIQFLQALRSRGDATPFIIFTGKGREEVAIQALNSGADFYLQKGGEPNVQFVELAHMITQAVRRKKGEEALRKSEERYRNVVESQTEFVTRFLPDGTHKVANAAYCRYFGKSCKEMINSWFIPNIPEEDKGRVRQHFASLTPENAVATIEHRIIMPDGSVRWQQWSDRAIFDANGTLLEYQSVGRDITDRKIVEEALRGSEEKFRSLVEHALEGILILDLQGTIFFANNATARTLEADDCAGLIGRNVMEFIAPESREDVMRDFIQVSQGHDAYLAQYNAISAKGNKFFVESIGKVISYEGKPADLISIRDITDRKQVEEELCRKNDELRAAYERLTANEEELRTNYEELVMSQQEIRESEERYRTFFTTSRDCVFITSREGIWIDFNDVALDLFGYESREELQQTNVKLLYADSQDRKRHLAIISEKGYSKEYPVNLKKKDGTIINTLITTVPRKDRDGTIIDFQGTIRDITDRTQAQEALSQANKKLNLLSSITRHDILNQLVVLKGYLELSKEFTQDPAKLGEFIKKEIKAAQTIEEQIGFTRDYQDMGINAPAWQNINASVSRAVAALQMRNIRVKVDCTGFELFADPLLERAFYNLIDNALGHGGDTITTVSISSYESDYGMIIVCEDDGVGIFGEAKKHLFEWGFGTHTGLGLYLVREILSITGITISETGEPGKGARFEIFVPKGTYRFMKMQQ